MSAFNIDLVTYPPRPFNSWDLSYKPNKIDLFIIQLNALRQDNTSRFSLLPRDLSEYIIKPMLQYAGRGKETPGKILDVNFPFRLCRSFPLQSMFMWTVFENNNRITLCNDGGFLLGNFNCSAQQNAQGVRYFTSDGIFKEYYIDNRVNCGFSFDFNKFEEIIVNENKSFVRKFTFKNEMKNQFQEDPEEKSGFIGSNASEELVFISYLKKIKVLNRNLELIDIIKIPEEWALPQTDSKVLFDKVSQSFYCFLRKSDQLQFAVARFSNDGEFCNFVTPFLNRYFTANFEIDALGRILVITDAMAGLYTIEGTCLRSSCLGFICGGLSINSAGEIYIFEKKDSRGAHKIHVYE